MTTGWEGQERRDGSPAEDSGSHAGWQLQGQVPRAYERYLVPALFAGCAERLLDAVSPGPGERVLDLACGTGIVARQAAGRVGTDGAVVGIDLNGGMLAVAGEVTSGMTPAIGWLRADAASTPLPDGAVDVVCCQQGLQFFPDRAAALAEMLRVLAPGGRVAVAVWRPIEHSPGYHLLAEALARHAGPDVAAAMRAPFGGPHRDELRSLLATAGFQEPRVGIGVITARFPSAEELLRRQAAGSPLAGPVEGLDPAAHDRLVDNLGQALAPHTDDDGVAFPMETWIATARR